MSFLDHPSQVPYIRTISGGATEKIKLFESRRKSKDSSPEDTESPTSERRSSSVKSPTGSKVRRRKTSDEVELNEIRRKSRGSVVEEEVASSKRSESMRVTRVNSRQQMSSTKSESFFSS